MRRLLLLAAAVLATACSDLLSPREPLPEGAVPATLPQRAALSAAFDSVGRCLSAEAARRGRPPTPRFYIVAGADSFVALNGTWAGGEFIPNQHAIAIAEHEMELGDALPGHPETAFYFRLWMHEAMHAYVFYYAGMTGHPAAWFGAQGPCGVLDPWWKGAWTGAGQGSRVPGTG